MQLRRIRQPAPPLSLHPRNAGVFQSPDHGPSCRNGGAALGELGERLAEIARRSKIADIYVFGSRSAEISARLRAHQFPAAGSKSDVDIGIEPRTGIHLSRRERVRLMIALEDLFDAARTLPSLNAENPP
jgi:predicted nucleotidyltransferase